MKTTKYLFLLLMTSFATFSCSTDDDNPTPVNEEEVITTLRLTLTPQGGGMPIIFETQDLDGDGPNPPVVSVSSALAANTTYNGSIELLNELD